MKRKVSYYVKIDSNKEFDDEREVKDLIRSIPGYENILTVVRTVKNPMEFVVESVAEEYVYNDYPRIIYEDLDFVEMASELCEKEDLIDEILIQAYVTKYIIEVGNIDVQ